MKDGRASRTAEYMASGASGSTRMSALLTTEVVTLVARRLVCGATNSIGSQSPTYRTG